MQRDFSDEGRFSLSPSPVEDIEYNDMETLVSILKAQPPYFYATKC
jgi:hypothetical protein